jgi:ribonuclease P protein component
VFVDSQRLCCVGLLKLKNELNSDRNSERFPARLRVKSRSDFRRVFGSGKVAADGVLVMHGVRQEMPDSFHEERPTSIPISPIGISISKRVGSAPVRNRWKRLIREAYRTQKASIPAGLILIVRPRKGAIPDYAAIRKSLRTLARRIDRKLSGPAR